MNAAWKEKVSGFGWALYDLDLEDADGNCFQAMEGNATVEDAKYLRVKLVAQQIRRRPPKSNKTKKPKKRGSRKPKPKRPTKRML